MKPTIRPINQGRTVAVVGDVYRFLATGEDTGGHYALWEAIVPRGGGPPPHVHSREEEGFYVLEGNGAFTLNDVRHPLEKGGTIIIPKNAWHDLRIPIRNYFCSGWSRRPACRIGVHVPPIFSGPDAPELRSSR